MFPFSSRPSDPSRAPRALTSFWAFHLLGWLALGLSMWLGTLSYTDVPVRSLIHKFWFAVSGGVLSLGLRPLYRALYRRNLQIGRLVIIAAICSYLTTVVWGAGYKAGVRVIDASLAGTAVQWPSVQSIFSGTLFFTFIMLAWSTLYIGIKYYRDVEAERARALAAESHAHRAELQALRYQLHPHFLFNTLNAISTLVVEKKNSEAERMVARLSDFLRLTLEHDTEPEVPLAEEVDFAERYLDIEQIRFGDRLEVSVDIAPDALSAMIPALILQPLVENAVRHGIAPLEAGGRVRIEGRRAGERLLLRVEDDGVGFGAAESTHELCASGVGLSNTHARLEALYGESFRFDLQRSDGGGCAVVLDLPFSTTSRADSRLVSSPTHRRELAPASQPSPDGPSPPAPSTETPARPV